MKVKSFAECSPLSILQYLWPAYSDNFGLENQFLVFFRVAILHRITVVCMSTYWLVSHNTLPYTIHYMYKWQ